MNNKKAMYMLAVFCFIFLTLIVYMTYTEIEHSNEYNSSGYNVRIKAKTKSTIRGRILDKNNIELAYSEKNNGIITRKYPYANLYSNVIGYVQDDQMTLLEKQYNSQLLGSNGINRLTNVKNILKNIESRGDDLYLTIDHNLQQAAYNAMGNHSGAIVALDVKTGAILAMVSLPDYNPNLKQAEQNLRDTSLYCRPIQMKYPPGSTFKTVSAAAIIDSGYENEIYNDTDGQYVIKSADGNPENDYICRNEFKKHKYGETNLEKAFTVSSNVYFAHLSTMIKTKTIQNNAESFMFNKTIPFDLPVVKSNFQKGNMTDADKIISSIGQGQTEATPLHLALIAATIANDGVMPKPYIVSKVKSGLVTVLENSVSDLGRVISSETSAKIKDYMRNVVTSGTGASAAINGIEVCGKTGTSENPGGEDHSLFIAFAPYENPEIAVCTVMENAGFGATYAAPATRTVIEKYFALK